MTASRRSAARTRLDGAARRQFAQPLLYVAQVIELLILVARNQRSDFDDAADAGQLLEAFFEGKRLFGRVGRADRVDVSLRRFFENLVLPANGFELGRL
jgi:hypothetical protein